MAPQRLVRRTSLRGMAILHEPTSDDTPGERLRFEIIKRTPTVLLDYLLETMVAVMALVVGVIAVIPGSHPTSLVNYLPDWLVYVYGALLILGGGTIIFGLIIRRFGTVLPMGLRMVAGTCAVYAFAVIVLIGNPGVSTFANSLLVACIAGWRAFLLRSTYLLVSKDASLDFYNKR